MSCGTLSSTSDGSSRSGRSGIATLDTSAIGECGRRDKAILKKHSDRLLQWDGTVYCTDNWATYASVIAQDTRVQYKATTHEIGRHHGRQRHGFGRFKQKSIIVSQCNEMVDLTMA